MKIKIWSSLACAVVVTGSVAHAQDATRESPFPGGTIDHAIEKIFEGEGGEGGLGLTKLAPSFSVPALRNDQLQKVVSGNTVRSNNRFAMYFQPDGRVEGWVVKYKQAPLPECKAGRAGYIVEDGRCLAAYDVKIDGRWSIRDDQICMPGIFHGIEAPPTPKSCHYMALLLNNVLFFTPEGDMLAKGWNLAKGDVRARAI